jgi:hypothetical protein
MLRKSILALATCVTLGAAALSPTTASAHGWGGWHGGWHGGGWYRGPIVRVYGPGYGGCMVRTWVPTPYGPALRWVNRCY